MISSDQNPRVCIIGGGASGICMARWLKDAGIACDVIEREEDIGGNWWYGKPASSVCRSTHLISSKRMSEYADFPMPDDYPDYPSHRLVLEYLRNYARHHDLYPLMEFNRSVENVERADDNTWNVTLDGNETRRYQSVVIANGHNWDPKFPQYPGHFDGLVMHSAQYKTPDPIRGKRVLIVGAGNSGCDIAVEAAQNAAAAFHSIRRGYHYYPKYFFGQPADVLNERFLRWRMPLWLRRLSGGLLVKMIQGSPEDYGLPKPDHKLLESHPIVNSQMLYYVGHGDIRVKPDIDELCGTQVRFKDGTSEEIDVIIYATGFKTTFAFMDRKHLNYKGDKPELYLHVFHPQYDNLFMIGLIQPSSGVLPLVNLQCEAITRYLQGVKQATRGEAKFRQRKAAGPLKLKSGIQYIDSTRPHFEVEHSSYRRELKKLIAGLA